MEVDLDCEKMTRLSQGSKDGTLAKAIAEQISEHGTHALSQGYEGTCHISDCDGLADEIQKVFDRQNAKARDVCPRCDGKVVLFSVGPWKTRKPTDNQFDFGFQCEKCNANYGYNHTEPNFWQKGGTELYTWTKEHKDFYEKNVPKK